MRKGHEDDEGEELDPELDELSGSSLEMLKRPPEPIPSNSAIPIETFDLIVTDECHRSIYNLWRQVPVTTWDTPVVRAASPWMSIRRLGGTNASRR
jgi:hypothetical protein